jgi:regulator of replication initiation timing
MSVITIPKPLRDKLGDEAVESFAMLLKEVEFEGRKDALVIAEERFERRLSEETAVLKVEIASLGNKLDKRITEEVAVLRVEIASLENKLDKRITEEVAKLDKRITEEVAILRVELAETKSVLRVEIAKTKSEIIKWMFIFWASQIAVIAALFALLR